MLSALGTLIDISELQLHHGRPVRLNSLGTFYLTLISEGVDTQEELTSNNIKSARIRFRPGQRLKTLIRNLAYEKVNDSGSNNGNIQTG